jgi:predicted acetyltransferase
MKTDSTTFTFLDPGDLRDGDLLLRLAEKRPADPTTRDRVPSYVFDIISADTGARAGEIHLRLGDTEDLRMYSGQIGYGVRPQFRGRRFAARALRLLVPLARRHGLTELWVTCNPENIASRRTCEIAGAAFVEIVNLPPNVNVYLEGAQQKCRYRLDLGDY